MIPLLSLYVRLVTIASIWAGPLLRPFPDAVSISITASSDDAWQASPGGTVDLTAASLPLGDNGTASRTVGLRFAGVTIPPGALITDATLTLRAAFTDPGATSLLIAGHDVGSSSTFTSSDGPADRWAAATASQVEWTPEDWTAGTDYAAPDLTPIIQAIVNRGDWASGNGLTLLIADNDGVTAIDRRAVSYNSSPAQAARLDITYQLSPNIITVTTTADVFDAGGVATTLPCYTFTPSGVYTAAVDPASLPGDDGLVSLREALCAANGDPAANSITFDLPGPSPYLMENFWGNLPGLYDDGTTIDGSSQPGYAGSPLIEIHGPPGNAGIIIEGGGTVIRGLAITGFTAFGIQVRHPSASGAVIEDNYLGVDPDGVTPDGMGLGIYVNEGASNVEIRDNVISGNGAGLWIETNDNLLEGNFIGTDAAGALAVGNVADGVVLLGPYGGTSTGNQVVDNVISGNAAYGIYMGAGVTNVVIQGNKLGTDASGGAALGNGIGVTAAYGATGALIGGADPSQRNIISGNDLGGVSIRVPGTSGHQVIGNYIGVDASGEGALGNGGTGVAIEYGATDTIVSQNVIAANLGRGVHIRFLDASGNTINDNSIGVTASGAPLGNSLAGVEIESGSNLLSGNIIAHNGSAAEWDGGSGVLVEGGAGNQITQNSIYANADRGIDLHQAGSEGSWFVTPNDPGDGDSGPNDLLNFPEFTSVSTSLVEGTACDGCTVEVFRVDPDPSTHGEGELFLASSAAVGGVFSIDVSAAGLGTCDPVTTTATDAAGNTSEFSANLSPGAGGFACLTLVPEGLFLVGIILLGGALVGGLGFWFGKTLPFAAGGFAVGGLVGAAFFLPLREPVRRLLNPPPPIIEAVPEPRLPTETPIVAIVLPSETVPAPRPETATATPTPTPTSTRLAPGPVTPTRTPTASAVPDVTGPAIKAVSDAPDPIYVTQPKGCSPNASVVSASITDPSGVASAVVIFFHTTIGQVPMTNVGGNNWQATLGPYTGTGDGTVDYQIRATDGEGNMSDSGFSQITVLACLP